MQMTIHKHRYKIYEIHKTLEKTEWSSCILLVINRKETNALFLYFIVCLRVQLNSVVYINIHILSL